MGFPQGMESEDLDDGKSSESLPLGDDGKSSESGSDVTGTAVAGAGTATESGAFSASTGVAA